LIYQSIADIYAANDTVRRQLAARIENLSEAQQTFRPAENVWSITEIIEHLSKTEQNMVQLIGMLLAKTEKAAAVTAAAASSSGEDAPEVSAGSAANFQPFSLDTFIEKVRDAKLTAPEQVRPGGGVPFAEALSALNRTRAAIEDLRPRLENANLGAVTYPHPAFGEFNIAQWLAFIGLHEVRHLRQIENLMASPAFLESEVSG
jgi:hypothetical protein